MVDSQMMSLAQPKAIFLHCLPAYRGYEVSDEVMESEQSLILKKLKIDFMLKKVLWFGLIEKKR